MATPTVNLRDLVVLIADPSSYLSMLVHGILRGFGAHKVLEVRNSMGVLQALSGQKIDILLCDARLRPHGGLSLTHAIRRKIDNENRMMPIMVMSSDTRETAIKRARDAGANMVIAKPISPANLYDIKAVAWALPVADPGEGAIQAIAEPVEGQAHDPGQERGAVPARQPVGDTGQQHGHKSKRRQVV